MKTVRERLKELNYKLYESLARSHEIAWNEWLPALSVQQDSYNSYPHIRNLEMYLDTIVNNYEESNNRDFFVSAVEMYVILAAILFHDIGRINKKEGEPDQHPSESSLIISGQAALKKGNDSDKNYKVWASLGIPSYEIALSISRICEYHDIDKIQDPENRKSLKNNLTSIYIDVYGEIRQKSLAALLTLLDHLDSAYTRIMPEYLRSAGEIKVVGAFRRVITGVYVDLRTHVVRTVLNEALPDGNDAEVEYKLNYSKEKMEDWGILQSILKLYPVPDETRFTIKEKENELVLSGERNVVEENLKSFINSITQYKKSTKNQGASLSPSLQRLFRNLEEYSNLVDGDYCFIQNFFKLPDTVKAPSAPDLIDILVIKDILRAEIQRPGPWNTEKRSWPQRILQDLILSNVGTNSHALSLIKPDLESLEIPISAWLIDHREHLYNCHGRETFEPVFNKSYLCEVALRMWELSTQIFGASYFTYENLAAMMREPDIHKVKLAVRRISIMTSSLNDNGNEGVIMAGDTNWKWMVENGANRCFCRDIGSVTEIIDKAGEPNG